MTSSSAIHVSAGYSRIAIACDPLRLSLRVNARYPGFDPVRNLLVTRAAIGSHEEPGRCPGHAR